MGTVISHFYVKKQMSCNRNKTHKIEKNTILFSWVCQNVLLTAIGDQSYTYTAYINKNTLNNGNLSKSVFHT